jgi:hypothetical protein
VLDVKHACAASADTCRILDQRGGHAPWACSSGLKTFQVEGGLLSVRRNAVFHLTGALVLPLPES